MTALYFLLGGAAFATSTFTVADDSDIIYGKGVHAFFDRNYEEAVAILLQAEKIESIDPRLYYFLGLAYLRQDKTEKADQYFKQAAQLEYSGRAARDYKVGEALRRIQGSDRLRIEKIRIEERANARIREQQQREARYGSENAADRGSLRQLTPQNQREDLATLQRTAENLGENAFGVKAINPINVAKEDVAVRRENINPFSDVTATISDVPAVLPPIPRTESPAPPTPVRAERQFVNPNVPVVERESVQSSTSSNPSPLRSAQAEAAKALGRGLGTLFSRRGSE